MENKFRLLHVAKYAKNHYKKTGDIVEDIKLCLQKDNYTPFSKEDVVGILSRNIVPLTRNDKVYLVSELRDACHPSRCWTRGYWHSTDWRDESRKKRDGEKYNQPYDWDTALIHYLLGVYPL